MSYVDYSFYVNDYGGNIITAENASRTFQNASDAVDNLTYCRIIENGLEGLTDFQKAIVQRVVCGLADWQTENSDILALPYSTYSINGVSVNIGGGNVKVINGTIIPKSLYSELVKSGLCYPGV